MPVIAPGRCHHRCHLTVRGRPPVLCQAGSRQEAWAHLHWVIGENVVRGPFRQHGETVGSAVPTLAWKLSGCVAGTTRQEPPCPWEPGLGVSIPACPPSHHLLDTLFAKPIGTLGVGPPGAAQAAQRRLGCGWVWRHRRAPAHPALHSHLRQLSRAGGI